MNGNLVNIKDKYTYLGEVLTPALIPILLRIVFSTYAVLISPLLLSNK